MVAKNGSAVTATVLIRFTQNLACVYLHSLLGLGLQFSVLRHQRPVKIAVEKTVKTGSDMNSKKMSIETDLGPLNMNIYIFSAFDEK